jgi:ubiquinone/menaquinone biosynthesis C-methylase UbiE
MAQAPDSDLVYNLYGGEFIAQVTRIALLLDVFTPLASGPRTAEDMARACRADGAGMRALLDYLSSVAVLDHQPESHTYTLTPTAATFLVRGRPAYAGDWVLANTDPRLWAGALETLRSGQTAAYAFPWAQDAWLESYSTSRVAYSLDMWRAAGLEPGRRPGLRLADLACGCAIKSLALAQADPTLHVTCVDSPSVLEVARDLAGRLGVEAQATFLPADLLADDLGAEQYDVALLGQITYILTPEQNAQVFRRAFRALKPGAVLVVDAIMAGDSPSEWASRATLLMKTLNGGAAHSFADYRRWLELTGFRQVVQHSEHWLSAVK